MLATALIYFAGMATLPTLATAAGCILWSRARNIGSDGCHVCDHAPTCAIGDMTNLEFEVRSKIHDLWWSRRKWHRDSWARHKWNPKNRR